MEVGLRRSGQFMQMARKIFREEGVPEELVWLGQVKSNWNPTQSGGLWKFPEHRGKAYGLRLSPWVDDRHSFEKATRAAARYLKDLYDHFGDWHLAMAAYNVGRADIDRAVSRAGSKSYLKIYSYIAPEARNDVSAVLATILIAKNPGKYGFKGIRPDPPLAYDVVEVPTATSLHLIAQTTNTSLDFIQMLNPELRRDVTPRGEAYRVRIPAGRADQFVAALKDVPAGERDRVPGGEPEARPVLMKVKARAGDTPAKLAKLYDISADEIAKMNNVGINSELPAGQEVKLPVPILSAESASQPDSPGAPPFTPFPNDEVVKSQLTACLDDIITPAGARFSDRFEVRNLQVVDKQIKERDGEAKVNIQVLIRLKKDYSDSGSLLFGKIVPAPGRRMKAGEQVTRTFAAIFDRYDKAWRLRCE